MEGLDYRNRPVLAAWSSVPGSAWSVIAKVDAQEIYEPLRRLKRTCHALNMFMAVASTLFVVLRLRQLAFHNRAEHEALVSHYGYLARYANDVILLLDAAGYIVEANQKAEEIYGYTRRELLALHYRELESGQPAEFPAASQGVIVEGMHRRKDGSRFNAEASLRSIQVDRERYIQCILRDVSERKKAEELLAQMQKQEAIGRLAGGVAHDLNNALTAIQAYAEWLKTKLSGTQQERRCAENILAAVARAARVTDSLLAFSEHQRLALEPVELNSLLFSSRQALLRLLGAGIELKLTPSAEPLVVQGEERLLRQALFHLAENAREAMPKGGRLEIEAAAVGPSGPPAQKSSWACLRIRDSGTGMSEEVRSRLFEPFFTTKGFGKGAGLGLPMVFGIVRQHGGRIEASSSPGQGTEFRIHLPLAQSASSQ